MSHGKLSKLLWVVLGATTTLLYQAPAYWLTNQLPKLSTGQLQALQSSGTVWAGKADLAVFDGKHHHALPGQLKWVFNLMALLKAQPPSLTLEHATLAQALQLHWADGAMRWNNGSLTFPAQWLVSIGAPWNTLKPEGQVHATWTAGHSAGAFQVEITWQDAQSALTAVRPLGEYKLTIEQKQPGNVQIQLATLRGPLSIDGAGEWTATTGFKFSGYANASVAAKPALLGLLSQMGRREGDRYRLGI
jgi:general secretion pathway protein N